MFILTQKMENICLPPMDTRFFSTLVAVVESGSFAQAARRQNLTAATVAQRVHTLEENLNLALVMRIGQTVQPTEQCQAILPRIKHILLEVGQLRGDADVHGLSGLFRLGAISTALGDYVPEIVQRFAAHAPKTELTIQPGTSSELYTAIARDELDLAIVVMPPFAIPKSLIAYEIADQPMVLVVPDITRETNVATLCTENPVLVFDRKSWGGQIAWDILTSLCVKPSIRGELDSLETIATLVARGMGVSIIPQWAGLTNYTGIKMIPLSGPSRKIVAIASLIPSRPKLVSLCLNQNCDEDAAAD